MALRLSLILLLLCMAHATIENVSDGSCVGGECVDEESSLEEEIGRRVLYEQGQRYISYGALKRDSIPCSQRGQSYYNCDGRSQVNPYHRGCSVITRCARDLH